MHEFCSLSLDLKTVEPSENAGEKLQVLEGIDKKLRQGTENFYCPRVCHQFTKRVPMLFQTKTYSHVIHVSYNTCSQTWPLNPCYDSIFSLV